MKNGQTTPLAAVVEKISMSLIDPFPHHPFYVLDDSEMIELIESIRKNGLITPIIVRPKGDRYLMLKRLGADVVARLPDRIYEGYGISMMLQRLGKSTVT